MSISIDQTVEYLTQQGLPYFEVKAQRATFLADVEESIEQACSCLPTFDIELKRQWLSTLSSLFHKLPDEISFKEITTTLNSINTTLRESSTQISFLEKLRSLNYDSVKMNRGLQGHCYGFSYLALSAFLLEQEAIFSQRLKWISSFEQDQCENDYEKFKSKITHLRETGNVIEAQQQEQHLVDMKAFFDTLSLISFPSLTQVFTHSLGQNAPKCWAITSPVYCTENPGFKPEYILAAASKYDVNQLETVLELLKLCFIHHRFSIVFSAYGEEGGHAINLNYAPDFGWLLVDPNRLPGDIYKTTSALVASIFKCDFFSDGKIFLELFCQSRDTLHFQQQCIVLKQEPRWNAIHESCDYDIFLDNICSNDNYFGIRELLQQRAPLLLSSISDAQPESIQQLVQEGFLPPDVFDARKLKKDSPEIIAWFRKNNLRPSRQHFLDLILGMDCPLTSDKIRAVLGDEVILDHWYQQNSSRSTLYFPYFSAPEYEEKLIFLIEHEHSTASNALLRYANGRELPKLLSTLVRHGAQPTIYHLNLALVNAHWDLAMLLLEKGVGSPQEIAKILLGKVTKNLPERLIDQLLTRHELHTESMLEHVCKTVNLYFARMLIERGVKPTSYMLMSVITNCKAKEIAELLVAHGVEPTTSMFEAACDKENIDAADLLFAHGCRPTEQMLIKAYEDQKISVVKWITTHGINASDQIFIEACIKGDVKLAQLFIDSGIIPSFTLFAQLTYYSEELITLFLDNHVLPSQEMFNRICNFHAWEHVTLLTARGLQLSDKLWKIFFNQCKNFSEHDAFKMISHDLMPVVHMPLKLERSYFSKCRWRKVNVNFLKYACVCNNEDLLRFLITDKRLSFSEEAYAAIKPHLSMRMRDITEKSCSSVQDREAKECRPFFASATNAASAAAFAAGEDYCISPSL